MLFVLLISSSSRPLTMLFKRENIGHKLGKEQRLIKYKFAYGQFEFVRDVRRGVGVFDRCSAGECSLGWTSKLCWCWSKE